MLRMIKLLFSTPILIFGCGNTLMGDDGFGPALIAHLQQTADLPPDAALLDAGTSISNFLFDLALSATKPRHIIILDAAFYPDKPAGSLMELTIEQLTPDKNADFAMHQFPAANLLRELRDEAGVGIHILAVQGAKRPDCVCEGLSPAVAQALSVAGVWVEKKVQALIRKTSWGLGSKDRVSAENIS